MSTLLSASTLHPPSLSTFQSVYTTLWSRATSLQYLRALVCSGSGDFTRVGVYMLEANYLFKVRDLPLLHTSGVLVSAFLTQ